MPARFEYYKDPDRRRPWSFVLKDPAGNPLMYSKEYSRRTTARRGMEAVRKGAPDKGRFRVRSHQNGTYSFVMTRTNRGNLCTSDEFPSRKAATTAMNRAMKWAAEAEDDDLRCIRILVPRDEYERGR